MNALAIEPTVFVQSRRKLVRLVSKTQQVVSSEELATAGLCVDPGRAQRVPFPELHDRGIRRVQPLHLVLGDGARSKFVKPYSSAMRRS